MDKESNEKICLNAAEKILMENFNPDRYAIGKRSECAVCLEFKDGKWEVYETERGSNFDESYHTTIVEAVMDMFDRLKKDSTDLKNMFLDMIISKRIA